METDVSVRGRALAQYLNAIPHKTIQSRESSQGNGASPMHISSSGRSALIEDSDRRLITDIIEITSPLA